MIGQKIRDLRKAKGLTLVELAGQVNVTPGHISQIERNMLEPSIYVLRRLSTVLDTPLAVLFSEKMEEGVLVIQKHKRTKVKFGDCNIEYEFFAPIGKTSKYAFNMEVMTFRLAPKCWAGDDMMFHASDECAYVIEGQLEYHIGDKIITVEQGGSIYVPENTGHFLYNPDEKEAVGICVVSPAIY